jgi:hypothetical protein
MVSETGSEFKKLVRAFLMSSGLASAVCKPRATRPSLLPAEGRRKDFRRDIENIGRRKKSGGMRVARLNCTN